MSRRTVGRRRLWRWGLILCAVASFVTLGAGTHVAAKAPKGPTRGGTLTVYEGEDTTWSEGLDPATDNDAIANASLMDAIYGELFQLGPKGKLIDDLATGFHLASNGLSFTLDLRPNVVFSDGTPFNAAAVISNWQADLAGASISKPPWIVSSISAPSDDTVAVNLKQPDFDVLNQFQASSSNWIASPSSESRLGLVQFERLPVGAGPFGVTASDIYSTKLVLKRNPHYWQKGLPYLDGVEFDAVASDQSALSAMEASGSGGQAEEFMSTPSLLASFKAAGFKVTKGASTEVWDMQLNTKAAPFNNLMARQAIGYALDSRAIDSKITDGTCTLTQSFTGPGASFYDPKVPGYIGYNLAKAKSLVRQLGGLTFTLLYTPGTVNTSLAEAEQSMFNAAGMKVSLGTMNNLAAELQDFSSGKWQIMVGQTGAYDTIAPAALPLKYLSTAAFSGVHDPHVDALIAKASGTADMAVRNRALGELAQYMDKQEYSPFICSPSSWDVTKKDVHGVGLTSATPSFASGPLILWQTVYMSRPWRGAPDAKHCALLDHGRGRDFCWQLAGWLTTFRESGLGPFPIAPGTAGDRSKRNSRQYVTASTASPGQRALMLWQTVPLARTGTPHRHEVETLCHG